MDGKVISGTALADTIKSGIKKTVDDVFAKSNLRPNLAVVRVGNDPASVVYVRNKEKACKLCGIDSKTIALPENTTEAELLSLLSELNNDKNVNGILVQLPLPRHISEKSIIGAIAYEKDVDCFHPINVGKIAVGDFDYNTSLLPCTPKGCVRLVKSVLSDNLSGQKVCVVGRSNIVGKPVAQLFLSENCTVKIVHSKTKNLSEECSWADILVVAIGKPKFITADMVKEGAVVIDVGINRTNDGICGDVDFNEVIKRVKYITPVPGGVGPMTIACLMENVLNAFLRQNR